MIGKAGKLLARRNEIFRRQLHVLRILKKDNRVQGRDKVGPVINRQHIGIEDLVSNPVRQLQLELSYS